MRNIRTSALTGLAATCLVGGSLLLATPAHASDDPPGDDHGHHRTHREPGHGRGGDDAVSARHARDDRGGDDRGKDGRGHDRGDDHGGQRHGGDDGPGDDRGGDR